MGIIRPRASLLDSGSVRLVRCGRAIAALFACLALAAIWAALPQRARVRRRIERAGWALLLAGFGVRVRIEGASLESALLVANHVSWLDIAVLGRAAGASFVAKSEVSRWPLIGALARRHGCLFADRNQRLASDGLAAAMRERLAGCSSLVLFPEGTTSDGTTLLPFRSGLFEAASSFEQPCVQPVAIAYRKACGEPLDAVTRRRIAWLGDDALLPHALALAAMGGCGVEIWFEPPVEPGTRKELAVRSRAALAARLLGGHADAALKRAA